MFAVAWALLYFLTVYSVESYSLLSANAVGMAVLYSVAIFFGLPFFLRYFEAQKYYGYPMGKLEQIVFSVSILAIGTKGEIFGLSTPFSMITGSIYVLGFLVFNKNLDISYSRIGIYSKEYYEQTMGEFPMRSEKLISQFRVLVYALPMMLLVATWLWNKD
ncbi:MAG: hypothetical protein KGY54_09010 [Oleiphilaceae bacterium]|nr:hypothetical protein [Oleiphilaceae bacterium]